MMLKTQCHLLTPFVPKFRYNSTSTLNINKYGVISSGLSYEWTNNSYANYLDNNDIGPYTVCRTVDRYNIFKYDMHIDRLIHTLNGKYKLYQSNTNSQRSEISDRISEKTIRNTILSGLNSFYQHDDYKEGEARIMIYINENKLFFCTLSP